MAANSAAQWYYFLYVIMICGVHITLCQCSVTYDKKSLIINGHRKILFSGSIHYPRSTPQMWEGLIQKAKDGGLNVIDTYVFWNLHEPSRYNYNFEGRNDLVGFIKLVHKAGLYVNLRIGPYICAEWNFGGFPVWLKYVEGISFRTNNEPFKREMQRFTQKIVQMMKDAELFQSQGGPIILSQIENEFRGNSKVYDDRAYVTWAAKMAVGLGTGVPWIMCKEDDAPDPIINTCNGFYCDNGFSPNKPYKPLMWTEAWGSWFNEFGGPSHTRPVEDLAFAVVRFIRKGGSFINYYMYHGGTNFGRTAGGSFITTSYDYDSPLDEYGMIREPKYSHLKDLHSAVKQCEWALVSADPIVKQFGSYEQAHIYYPKSGGCAAFLTNYHLDSAATVRFNNRRFRLPPWSISILPDCETVVYNTAQVRVQRSEGKFVPTGTVLKSWQNIAEDITAVESDSKIITNGLVDQLSITRDASDYLWYSTSVEISPREPFLHGGNRPTLSVRSEGDVLHVFINGQLSGSAHGNSKYRQFTFEGIANLRAGTNKVSLLSVSVGLPNNGRHVEALKSGIHGPVILNGVDHGSRDLSRQKWSYKVGLRGEAISLFFHDKNSLADWASEFSVFQNQSLVVQNQRPLTWYKAHFDAPAGNDPLALDMGSMGKGQVWINGQSTGRYWTIYAKGNCGRCSYAGTFRPTKCQTGCGQPSQRWYHVPRSWLRPTQNQLVVFEEFGGDVTKISLVRRTY